MADKPISKVRAGVIQISTWENKTEKGSFKTITHQRSYKDKEDNWKNTQSYRIQDIPRLIRCLWRAYDEEIFKEKEKEEEKK